MLVSIQSMTEEQIAVAVSDLVASLGDPESERDFQNACAAYNSVFFRDLPPFFVQKACAALNQYFMSNTNNFWVKQSNVESF